MDGNTIKQVLLELPTSPIDKVPDDGDIWEANDGGAHFKMTRHELPIDGSDLDFFSLSISGPESERSRLIAEFSASMGEPEMVEKSESEDGIDFVGWAVQRGAVR